jgi:hypothetical protein
LNWVLGLGRRLRISPEVEMAGNLFRLQRHGVVTPELLAVGERHSRPWRTESMLLIRPSAVAVPLLAWLAAAPAHRQRGRLIRDVGALLRRVREAGCTLALTSALQGSLAVRETPAGLQAVLTHISGLARARGRVAIGRELRALSMFAAALPCNTERLRLLLGFLGERQLKPALRLLATQFLRRARQEHGQVARLIQAGGPQQ